MRYIYIYIHIHSEICGIYIHTHIYILSEKLLSHKKNEILPFAATWMDLEGTMLSEISQTEKDKYCILSLTI